MNNWNQCFPGNQLLINQTSILILVYSLKCTDGAIVLIVSPTMSQTYLEKGSQWMDPLGSQTKQTSSQLSSSWINSISLVKVITLVVVYGQQESILIINHYVIQDTSIVIQIILVICYLLLIFYLVLIYVRRRTG